MELARASLMLGGRLPAFKQRQQLFERGARIAYQCDSAVLVRVKLGNVDVDEGYLPDFGTLFCSQW